MHFWPKPWLAGSSTSTVRICPMAGIGRAAPSPFHATNSPLRLMFSVYIALLIQRAGDVTWHRSLTSMRGLSRRLIFLIAVHSTLEFSAGTLGQQYRKWVIVL